MTKLYIIIYKIIKMKTDKLHDAYVDGIKSFYGLKILCSMVELL